MLELRPIVVDENNIVLGGNMRLKACKEAGLTEVYIVKAEGLTELQKDEFIVKDNVGFGEWDWDMLANEWDVDLLDEWGLDVPIIKEYEEIEPSGYDLTQKWFLNVEFENEQDCEKWYNSLIEEGLICKIVQ
jgi:ParB-like chromosome segregation protein Spo0J